MRANTRTSLSLYDFGQIMGINPLHLAGVELSEIAGPYCSRPWIQFSWQDADRVGREAVAQAIAEAESAMEQYLGFRLLPTYEIEDIVTTQPYRPEFVNLNARRVGGFAQSFQTKWGYVIEAGRRATTALSIIQQSGQDIVWSNDSYWQIGTVLADATGITDPEEVRVFYPDHSGDPTWEIRPATVSIDNVGVATITFRRELAVEPDLWDALTVEIADGTDDDDFLSTVDVFRVYSDPSAALGISWEPLPVCSECGQGAGNCPQCSAQTQGGCFLVNDPLNGGCSFAPASWNADTLSFDAAAFTVSRQPDRLEVAYLAGRRDRRRATPLKTMERQWQTAVAYFAASLLERPPCDCSPDQWERWREDLSTTVSSFGQGGQIIRVSNQDLACPFGTRRGAIYAWHQVLQGEAKGQGVRAR